jgi:hypothetical protein
MASGRTVDELALHAVESFATLLRPTRGRNPVVRRTEGVHSLLFCRGAGEIADITQQALDALDLPNLSVSEIEAAMARENVQRNHAIKRRDIAFYQPGELSERLFAYVKAHQAGITV